MGRFTDKMYADDNIEDSLRLAQERSDSTLNALNKIKIEKERADSLHAATEEAGTEYTYGMFSDDEGMKHRVQELSGGGIFSEGTKGEQPLFQLASGFIPVPNLDWNKIPLDQPSAYMEAEGEGLTRTKSMTPLEMDEYS